MQEWYVCARTFSPTAVRANGLKKPTKFKCSHILRSYARTYFYLSFYELHFIAIIDISNYYHFPMRL